MLRRSRAGLEFSVADMDTGGALVSLSHIDQYLQTSSGGCLLNRVTEGFPRLFHRLFLLLPSLFLAHNTQHDELQAYSELCCDFSVPQFPYMHSEVLVVSVL